MGQFNIGDIVRMQPLDEHNRAKGKLGTITQVNEWGAHLTWNGGTGNMRLLYSEMIQTVTTGNECKNCGSLNMVRAGACMLCRDCGDTSGGCG